MKTIKRVPRPKNITFTSINYNKTLDNTIYKKLIYHLIVEYITKGFTINQKQISIHQMSLHYNIPLDLINQMVNQITKETGDLILGSDLVSAHRNALSVSLNSIFDTKGHITEQVALLLRSQGGTYKPYISSTVNQALKMMLDSDKNMMEWADKMMPKNSEITNLILNQSKSETLSANEAIRYMRQIASGTEGQKALPASGQDQSALVKASLPQIFEEHQLASLPNVRANGADVGANINVKSKRIIEDPKALNLLDEGNMEVLLDEEVSFEDLG
jgi:hypothetical protein